ncbi:MAG: hypothetical protein AB7V18_09480 [Pyrinomonadaceae bacterium]
MTQELYRAIAILAILAPGLHIATDIWEVVQSGFSALQLGLNYLAFILIPFLMMGLYAVQLPRIKWPGLAGALLYGAAFIYFAHSTLSALEYSVRDYAALWTGLGKTYTLHGLIMIVGGALFAIYSLQARVLWRPGIVAFLLGLAMNLVVAAVQWPEILQTPGSTVRNAGLISIGLKLLLDKYEGQ